MKILQVVQLSNIYEDLQNKKMDINTTYKFAMLMQKSQSSIEFYQREFKKILDDYAQKDENGQLVYTNQGEAIAIKKELEEECNQKIKELQEIEVDLSGVTFRLDELKDLNLTLGQLTILMPLIVPQ